MPESTQQVADDLVEQAEELFGAIEDGDTEGAIKLLDKIDTLSRDLRAELMETVETPDVSEEG